MSIFTQRFNPITGKLEWGVHEEDYDFQQEVARSAYADMLHDWERNMKYHRALKTAIDELRKSNKRVIVLDIGTGSGLLAMMAAKYGADTVYACEAFKPAADCARKVISDNGLRDKIMLIEKRSTDLTVGQGCDLPERANLLVTEVFDTELIGEGALGTFSHAHKHLLTPDCVVIPSSAVVYAQVAQSASIRAWHTLPDLKIDGVSKLKSPEIVRNCAGAPAVHDLQLSQLDECDFLPLTGPVVVNTFDFSRARALKFNESVAVNVTAVASGRTDVVFMWWDLEMLPGGEILSCAPKWAHPDGPQNLPWRDHWMQAVYYPVPITVTDGEPFCLGVHHDEYSFWFSTQKDSSFSSTRAPVCTCSMHVMNSRSRIGMINDFERYGLYVSALTEIESPETKVVYVCGDSIPLTLIAGKLGFKKVFLCETEPRKLELLHSYVKANNLESKVQLIQKKAKEILPEDLDNEKISVVLSEPFFSTSILQWDNIHFWYVCRQLEQHLDHDVVIIPSRMEIHGVAAHFTDLWKIRAPVKETEGFDLTHFDEVIQSAISNSDSSVEPQPLWEYPSLPLGDEFQLCAFDFRQPLPVSCTTSQGRVHMKTDGTCNGIAIWVKFVLNDRTVTSLGPTERLDLSKHIPWYRHSQQGVHLFPSKNVSEHTLLEIASKFDPRDGTLSFEFRMLDT